MPSPSKKVSESNFVVAASTKRSFLKNLARLSYNHTIFEVILKLLLVSPAVATVESVPRPSHVLLQPVVPSAMADHQGNVTRRLAKKLGVGLKDREKRVGEVLQEVESIGQLERLHFDDVVFRYRDASENAIDHLSFSTELGDTIAFVGPSGSRKSTLVKLLVGLYTPVSGAIMIDDVPVNELRYNRVRKQIGFVTQDPQLFSGTIRENLQFVKADATDEEMYAVLEQAAALGILERSGQGLDTRLGEGGARVSGGERQRLSIARALLREPRLFIFDEATSALDSITEQEISRAVRAISARREHIVILIAHRLSTIAHADTIYVLKKGRVVEQGSHDELLKRLGLYYAMWRQQIGEREVPEPQTVAALNEEAEPRDPIAR